MTPIVNTTKAATRAAIAGLTAPFAAFIFASPLKSTK
jgi:hypothetical protein